MLPLLLTLLCSFTHPIPPNSDRKTRVSFLIFFDFTTYSVIKDMSVGKKGPAGTAEHFMKIYPK